MGNTRVITDKKEYIAALTGLRGIAATWVFLFHFPSLHPDIRPALSSSSFGQVLQQLVDMGFSGVNLFFVLSGFLLALPFAGAAINQSKSPALGVYFKRRVLRVYPAYYAQLAILLLLGAWFITWRPLESGELMAHLVMFFYIGPEPVDAMVAVWWTLPVEFSFYLLLPLIAWFMRPGKWLFLLGASILLSLVYRLWATSYFADDLYRSFLASVQLPGTLPLFLIGASGAILVKWMLAQNKPKPSWQWADFLFVAGALGVFSWLGLAVLPNMPGFWRGHWAMLATPVVLGTLFTMIVLGLFWGSRIGKRLCANPVVYFSGLISYSLYLWHFPVMQQVQLAGGEAYNGLPGIARFAICLVAVFGVASVSYFLFERPFFRLAGKRKQALP